jgi:hypothetical protein
MDVLGTARDFSSLSLRDLLEARDQFHFQLMNKMNVVGTAVGLYLIRDADPWPSKDHHPQRHLGQPQKAKAKEERTFGNSQVRYYSWPCVLVLTSEWIPLGDFGKSVPVDQLVPRTIYMTDGRSVPICIVKVSPASPANIIPNWRWPDTRIGGGFPLIVHSQGVDQTASIGCVVSDGHTKYALTNRHVCGEQGTPVYTQLRGNEVQVGSATGQQLTRKLFSEVYPQFTGRQTYVNLDAGLIRIDDYNDWTNAFYGLQGVGSRADLNALNLGVQLIDQRVQSFGAASGHLSGKIKALFYRYKSVGGYDYVSDFLIAPDDPNHQTHPGDSGTIWHLEVKKSKPDGNKIGTKTEEIELKPLALEWGGQGLLPDDSSTTVNFTLATNLTTVCQLLDVEIEAPDNTDARPFWGTTGHYSIAELAIQQVPSGKLKSLLESNLRLISFDLGKLDHGKISAALRGTDYVPLADVPDLVWKKMPTVVTGGRDVAKNTGPEHPNHYADVDQPAKNGGKTLLKMCLEDPQNLSVDVWRKFYTANGSLDSRSRGLLPFRVWQVFQEMVKYLEKKNYRSFLAAAGVLAHYVGDACQPLHGSYLSDGFRDKAHTEPTKTGGTKQVWPGKGVHSAYEDKMIDENAKDLFKKIGTYLGRKTVTPRPVEDGHAAAVCTVDLMAFANKTVDPEELVSFYVKVGPGASRKVIDALWEQFDKGTAQVMAAGIKTLSHLWKTAWEVGGGAKATTKDLKAFTTTQMKGIYEDVKFVQSFDLDHIGPELK